MDLTVRLWEGKSPNQELCVSKIVKSSVLVGQKLPHGFDIDCSLFRLTCENVKFMPLGHIL